MKSVLHVLPHPGGGGETYVDLLSGIGGYVQERRYLAPSAGGAEALRALPNGVARALLEARQHDLIHVHGETAGALCFPALRLRPSVVTFHGLNLLRRLNGRRRSAAIVNMRYIVRAASRSICVSQSEYDEVEAVVGATLRQRVVLIRNGVNPLGPASPRERGEAREAVGVAKTAFVGASVGGLDDVKDPTIGVRAAISAAEKGIPIVVLVVGDGPLRLELEEIVSRGGIDAVRLLGFRHDVRTMLSAADFFLLSSRREGLSLSLLEAMSMGLAPVVSDAPGNVEAVGDAGIIVPRGDSERFASVFEQLHRDEVTRRSLGARARERVATLFRAEEMRERTRAVYDEILHVSPERSAGAKR